MTKLTEGTAGAENPARIAAALADYPHIDAAALADLLRWFRKEASALEVGMIASDPALSAQYQLLKRDHLSRFTRNDMIAATLVTLTAIAALALMVLGAD